MGAWCTVVVWNDRKEEEEDNDAAEELEKDDGFENDKKEHPEHEQIEREEIPVFVVDTV